MSHTLLTTIEVYVEENPQNPRKPYAAMNESMEVVHGATPESAVKRLVAKRDLPIPAAAEGGR